MSAKFTEHWASISAIATWCGALGTFLAPLFALQISAALDRRRDVARRRYEAFQLLMQWRAAVYLEQPVRVLNSIDVLFADVREVREAWSDLYQSYSDSRLSTPEGSHIRQEKLERLLETMSMSLGYSNKFNKADYSRVYNPDLLAKHYELLIARSRQEHAAFFTSKSNGVVSQPSSPPSGAP